MTLQEFIQKYNGRGIDFDGAFGDQCVDLMNQYLVDVLGIANPIQVLSGQTAFQIYENANDSRFTKIANTPEGVPQPGDIVFWNTTIGNAGHVAVFVSGDQNSFTSFDQNWPGGSVCHEQAHDYTGVAGWLRLAQQQGEGTYVDSATFTNLVHKATQYDGFVKAGYNTVDDVTKKTDQDQATIDGLNKRLGALSQTISDLEGENTKVNAQAASIAASLEQVKTDDSNLGKRNLDLSHQVDALTSDCQALYSALQAHDQLSALTTIDNLRAPHEELVKQVQPVIEGLADAALKKTSPQKKTQNPIMLFLNWLKQYVSL